MNRFTLKILALLPLLAISALAEPPGNGRGGRGPGGGGGGGPLPAEDRDMIHSLFAEHKSIKRKVTMTEKGYKARTTSKDPKVVAKIQEHVAAMEKRLDSGFPVRRWDPAFEEFFQHYGDLKTTIRKIKKGVEVEVVAKTPEAIKVAQNHAGIISGFVKKGDEQHHAKHPAALAGNAGEEAKPKPKPKAKVACAACAAEGAKGACKECQDAVPAKAAKAKPDCEKCNDTPKAGAKGVKADCEKCADQPKAKGVKADCEKCADQPKAKGVKADCEKCADQPKAKGVKADCEKCQPAKAAKAS